MLNNLILIQTSTNSWNSTNYDNPSASPLLVHHNCLLSIHMADIYLPTSKPKKWSEHEARPHG